MRIAFYGGQTAGMISLLSLLGTQHSVRFVFPEDRKVETIAELFKLSILPKKDLNTAATIRLIANSVDLFICCHGKKILSREFVMSIKCVNLHPCLYRYKGARPVAHLIADQNQKASVAAHWMNERVDEGKVILEKFITVNNIEKHTEADVYNLLYPLYTTVILQVLDVLKEGGNTRIVREMTVKDMRRVWEIRNSPDIRKLSFDTKYIPFTTHKLWFMKLLSNRNNHCYVLEIPQGKQLHIIGYIRYVFEKKSYTVSIAIDLEFREKGYGFYLLSQTLSTFTAKKTIVANIKKGNVASIRLFDKAGFDVQPESSQRIIMSRIIDHN